MTSRIISAFQQKTLLPSEKVTPSEEVEKGTNLLNYMEYLVVKISRKNLDNFQEKSTASIGWFNIDNE